MTSKNWASRPRSTSSWQYLLASEADNGERWRVVWDTMRKPGTDGRNTAVEKSESAALERARHMLRMGFVVYEIRNPSGAIFLEEGAINEQLGVPAVAR